MTQTKTLRVFCPTHEAAFETTVQNAKILCDITGHALSVGFPVAEFWEFCCNCETYAPSRLDKGEKVRKNCYGCGGDVSKHFVCAECKTISFECSAQTKGKKYFINLNGAEPVCPGCHAASQNGATVLHQCKEIEAAIFTSRDICPFCLDKTTPAAEAPKQLSQTATVSANSVYCPQCQATNQPNAVFCGNCKHQLRTDVAISKPGSDVNKTQMLGSLCPNCSTPVPPDSGFCGECGQAVKKAPPPPPPPPPPRNVAPQTASVDLPNSTAPVSTPNTTIRNIAIVAGGAFLFIVIMAIISNTSKSSGNSAASYSNESSSKTSNSRPANNNATKTNESSFSVVGSYGYITINVNLRSGPDRRYDDLGTLYQDTRVKILQVARRDDSSDWWEVKVENPNDYGCSSVDSSRCGKDDPSDSTQGWINSKFVAFR